MLDGELIAAMQKEAQSGASNECAATLRAAAARLQELNTLCAGLYQVIGILADKAKVFDTVSVEKALNNALAGAEGRSIPHEDLLPFCVDCLP